MSRLTERIENYNRAFNLFKLACCAYKQDENSDINKLALTQGFEIVVELGWKVLKDYLAQKGIRALTPNDVIKEAFSAEIIADGQLWVNMVKDRNTSSHEYNTEKMDEVLAKVSTIYYNELCAFSKLTEDFHD